MTDVRGDRPRRAGRPRASDFSDHPLGGAGPRGRGRRRDPADRVDGALERATSRLATDATPESSSKLFDFLDRVRAERGFVKRFVVRKGSKLSFVRVADVDWIDVTSNYIRLHVAGTKHLVRQTLKSVEGQLDPDVFIRVHRSIIINVDRVESVEPHLHGEYEVLMQDGTRFTTSRSYSSRLRALLR